MVMYLRPLNIVRADKDYNLDSEFEHIEKYSQIMFSQDCKLYDTEK